MYALHIDAAVQRENTQLARHAQAVWVGTHQDHSGLQHFVQSLIGGETLLPSEALPSMLAAASVGLEKITRAQFYKQED